MKSFQDPQQAADDFIRRLKKADQAIALTGAGVSTDSGIPDFRGPSGLYSKISPQTFDIEFFYACPDRYYQVAIEHIHTLADREPNPTHFMLAELEKQGLLSGLVTQNIDGLHQKAGIANLIEFHGDVVRFYCTECDCPYTRQQVDSKIRQDKIPNCDQCGALIRPGIVFFGDMIPPDALYTAGQWARESDVFVVLGSSLEVNPAASLALEAQRRGSSLLIVNRGPTRMDPIADVRYEVAFRDFSEQVMKRLTQ